MDLRGKLTMGARLPLLLFLTTVAVCARGATLEHVPLRWQPTSQLQLGTAQMSEAPIQFETFKDVRENKEAVGENREEERPRPVTTRMTRVLS